MNIFKFIKFEEELNRSFLSKCIKPNLPFLSLIHFFRASIAFLIHLAKRGRILDISVQILESIVRNLFHY